MGKVVVRSDGMGSHAIDTAKGLKSAADKMHLFKSGTAGR